MLQAMDVNQLNSLLKKCCDAILSIPELHVREIILFGSYARGDANEESDVDIMILTDVPREELNRFQHALVQISVDLGWEFTPLVSPCIQNYAFFREWSEDLPFYRNVDKEGVRLYAA